MGIDIRYPNINAKTEAEQQIKSYLIQVADQLNFALKDIDTSNNTVVVAPTPRSLLPSSQTSVSPMADFVVEQGTSGIWEYRKWYSGKVECWGKWLIGVLIHNQWGSLYCSSVEAYPFPSGLFTSAPKCQVTAECRDTNEWAWLAVRGETTKDYTPAVRICSAVRVEATTGYNILYYAIGNWK